MNIINYREAVFEKKCLRFEGWFAGRIIRDNEGLYFSHANKKYFTFFVSWSVRTLILF